MGKQNRARSKCLMTFLVDKKPIDLGRLWTLRNAGFHLALGCPTRWLPTFSFSIDWKVLMCFSLSEIGSLPLSTRIKIHEVFIVWSKSRYSTLFHCLCIATHCVWVWAPFQRKRNLLLVTKTTRRWSLDAYCWGGGKLHKKLKLGVLCSSFSYPRGLWPH